MVHEKVKAYKKIHPHNFKKTLFGSQSYAGPASKAAEVKKTYQTVMKFLK